MNAAVVLMLAVAACLAAFVGLWFDDRAVVSASSRTMRVVVNVVQMGFVVLACVPFAAVAGSRTWVHAREYCVHRGTGWRGVVEAGAFGFLVALAALSWSIVNQPAAALPYVVGDGGGAALLGLAIGLILRSTALFTLRRMVNEQPSHG